MVAQGRRVAVTGIALITPLGNDLATNWDHLKAGRSGIGLITRFDASALPVRIAGEVRNFEPDRFIDKRDLKKMDPFSQYAVAAAQMAMDDAALSIHPDTADRAGVIIGVGMGGMETIERV